GWFHASVTVTFVCVDLTSGIQTCPTPVTLNTDGTNRTATGTAVDKAGNTASVTTSPIKIDKTPPSISYSVSQQPNSSGWYGGPVTVTFSCSDALSGVATCPSPVVMNYEGAAQTITGT